MDFKDVIKQLSERVEKLKDSLQTEEATKNAFIMPMISALGYDVFNPMEVVPEYTCDIGTKKGEKIDYAIVKDGDPIILIECKHCEENLNLHDNQLLRYFNVSKAKFGVLTNGIIYRFYTDLEQKNIMDDKPFLEIDLFDIRDNQVDELKKFHKSYFDVDNIMSSANELKYMNELKSVVASEFSNPSVEFVKMFASRVYEGKMMPKIIDQFTLLVKKSIQNHINDIISDRLNIAIKSENKQNEDKPEVEEHSKRVENDKNVLYSSEDGSIKTTLNEMEAFLLIKSILRKEVSPDRIFYRDAKSYFAILLDDNNRKGICRLYLEGNKKSIGIIGDDKKEIKHEIESLDDIYQYADELTASLKKFL